MMALDSQWRTTVSGTAGGLSYDFDFTHYCSLTVGAGWDGVGTLNLWDVPQSIFDGLHVLTVK